MGYPEAKEVRTQVKERRKKDNHNAIERRRRYHINERITDLLALLPSHEDMKPHKGRDSIRCYLPEFESRLIINIPKLIPDRSHLLYSWSGFNHLFGRNDYFYK